MRKLIIILTCTFCAMASRSQPTEGSASLNFQIWNDGDYYEATIAEWQQWLMNSKAPLPQGIKRFQCKESVADKSSSYTRDLSVKYLKLRNDSINKVEGSTIAFGSSEFFSQIQRIDLDYDIAVELMGAHWDGPEWKGSSWIPHLAGHYYMFCRVVNGHIYALANVPCFNNCSKAATFAVVSGLATPSSPSPKKEKNDVPPLLTPDKQDAIEKAISENFLSRNSGHSTNVYLHIDKLVISGSFNSGSFNTATAISTIAQAARVSAEHGSPEDNSTPSEVYTYPPGQDDYYDENGFYHPSGRPFFGYDVNGGCIGYFRNSSGYCQMRSGYSRSPRMCYPRANNRNNNQTAQQQNHQNTVQHQQNGQHYVNQPHSSYGGGGHSVGGGHRRG